MNGLLKFSRRYNSVSQPHCSTGSSCTNTRLTERLRVSAMKRKYFARNKCFLSYFWCFASEQKISKHFIYNLGKHWRMRWSEGQRGQGLVVEG
uniref:Putative ovule protein n=1 Tax=Solanum chacoense TaxID=4108 RepID=A0A0V0HMV1_SOLCH